MKPGLAFLDLSKVVWPVTTSKSCIGNGFTQHFLIYGAGRFDRIGKYINVVGGQSGKLKQLISFKK